jgi:uridine kinase
VKPAQLLSEVARCATEEPILVAVDGLAGSGKSTIAGALPAELEGRHVSVVPVDEFYEPDVRAWRGWTARQGYERHFDHIRVERELLQPLRHRTPARYAAFDWTHRTGGGTRRVDPVGIVVVEGVFLLRPRLRGYWHASIWVAAPREVREHRLRQRAHGDAEWINQWMRAEDHYIDVDDPARAASLVVAGA